MKIFIIDDDQFCIFLVQNLLKQERQEDEVISFLSAKEGIESLLACKDIAVPEVILLDLNMPVMDGWQFLEALALNFPEIKDKCRIFILTSSIDPEEEKRAATNPLVSGFIQKPASRENIKVIYQG